eukprot:TRINITY_DN10951_c0_g1_i18.p1 TRINITY_DN10951_c0_g1~~TRINITY_DN10951_c0_g1_i18.p1  ORF type:complete len:146 (-),score=23.19 TRINITY_DN10951_c0_g1_i18:149-586(-)
MERPTAIPEIFVSSKQSIDTLVYFARDILKEPRGAVVIKGAGAAMDKAMQLASKSRNRFKDIYMQVEICRLPPAAHGYNRKFTVSVKITLSKRRLDPRNTGFIPPLSESVPAREETKSAGRRWFFRGARRGFRGRGRYRGRYWRT